MDSLEQVLLWSLPILAAIVFHEVAHGWVAWQLGDSTAYDSGRLTLNPLAHVDPLGTVILPLLLVISQSGFLFGWAKPVPVNAANLGNPRRDMMIVAAAGPVMNFLLAIVAALVFHAIVLLGPADEGPFVNAVLKPVLTIAQYAVLMNVSLGVFNLLPIPPLDGGRVLSGLLPIPWARVLARVEPFGFLVLVVLLSTNMLDAVLHAPARLLIGWLLG